MPRPGFWWVYVLERADGSYYTGISTDPRRRFEQHRSGKGARAMQVSRPERLLSLEPVGPYAQALRREAQVKGLAKAAKRAYAAEPASLPRPAETGSWLKRRARPAPTPRRSKPR